MIFSEYTLLEKLAQAVDPLGLRRPAGALQDVLFPQFTVLTRHPSYLGLLCCVRNVLQGRDTGPAEDRAHRFRQCETLWGLACAAADDSVLNVTKYQRLLETHGPVWRLPAIAGRHDVFKKLSYGTFGHYGSPAASWGLLDRQGATLTAWGQRLGRAFAERDARRNLASQLGAWLAGEPFDLNALARLGEAFGVNARPGDQEHKVWRDLIAQWCTRELAQACLWEAPLPVAVLTGAASQPEGLAAFWRTALAAYPPLGAALMAAQRFERLGAAVQLVFERRLALAEFEGRMAGGKPPWGAWLAEGIVRLAAEYAGAPGFQDAGRLFASLAQMPPRLAEVERCVIEHHVAHQQRKGVSPFITHEGIVMRGRVEREAIGDLLQALDKAPRGEAFWERLQFHYRRDWHFAKCRLWTDFAARG